MLAAVRHFTKAGDDLQKMAARLRLPAEALSELGFAAEQSGSSLQSLGSGLFRMNRRIANAARGTGPAVRALEELGLSAEELQHLRADEQFKIIADRLKASGNQARAAQQGFEILGDNFRDLVPLLAQGADGINALQEQARRLGLTVSGEAADSAAALSDRLNILKRVLLATVFEIGGTLAPIITDAARRVTAVVVRIGKWVKLNRDLVATVFRVGVAVLAAGAALVLAGTLILGLAKGIGLVIGAAAIFGTVLVVAAKAVALLVSPIGLVTAALVGLTVWFFKTSDVGGKALQWLGDRFGELWRRVASAMGGIRDALIAGDLALAAKIAWLMIRAEWERGVGFVQRLWIRFRQWLLQHALAAFFGVVRHATDAFTALRRVHINLGAWFNRFWQNVRGDAAETWNAVAHIAGRAAARVRAALDGSFDLDAELRRLDRQFVASQKAEQRRRGEAEQFIEEDRQRELQGVEAERRQRQKVGDARLRSVMQQLEQSSRHADKETQKRLDQAREELRQAIEEAADRRERAEEEMGPSGMGELDDWLSRFQSATDGLGENLRSDGVVGTFNPAAVDRMFAGGAMDRTAQATEETARNTRRMLDRWDQAGLAFA
ncbi:MAG: phage tail tape measure protein [Phycisphaeraceae bacterium]